MSPRRHGRPRVVARRKLAPLVPEEGMRVQSPPLLLLRAVPRVDAYTQRGLAVAREELELLRVVPALEAERCSCRVMLDISSSAARRSAREQVLEELRCGWLGT